MIKRIMVLFMALLIPSGMSLAQGPSDAPIYARYCSDYRQVNGAEGLIAMLDEAETQLQDVEEVLTQLDTGISYLVAVELAEETHSTWRDAEKIECMAALAADMNALTGELLVAMLYGQTTNVALSDQHRNVATSLIGAIRERSSAARQYLSAPLPTPTGTPSEPTPEPTEVSLRPASDLILELDAELRQSGVTVLQPLPEGIQVVAEPNDVQITVRLDRFEAAENDYPNTLFTFERLSQAMAGWDELSQVTSIVIETYEEQDRVLYVETSGQNFRDFYFNRTIDENTFANALTIEIGSGDTEDGEDTPTTGDGV